METNSSSESESELVLLGLLRHDGGIRPSDDTERSLGLAGLRRSAAQMYNSRTTLFF